MFPTIVENEIFKSIIEHLNIMKINYFSARGIVFLIQYPVAYLGWGEDGEEAIAPGSTFLWEFFFKNRFTMI